MSRDPLEELFGELPEEPEPQPQPVPARARLAQEQAERVRTAQLDMEPSKKSRGRVSPAALPWIIVGAVAVVALFVSIAVVSFARGGDAPVTEPTSAPTPTQTTTPAPSPSEEPEEDPEEEAEEEPAGPPTVEVGPTSTMAIEAWGVTSELSGRFGSTSYAIPDNVNLVLTSDLLNSFPDSCAAMRQGWGATRSEAGTFSVLRPAESCAAAPELYDEIWGLTDAWVKTFR